MVIVPSVEIRGDMFILFIKKPLNKPSTVPERSVISIAIGTLTPDTISFAKITEVRLKVEPTDRSIPPVSITIVILTVIIPTTATCLKTLVKLSIVKKYGLLKDKAINKTTKNINIP